LKIWLQCCNIDKHMTVLDSHHAGIASHGKKCAQGQKKSENYSSSTLSINVKIANWPKIGALLHLGGASEPVIMHPYNYVQMWAFNCYWCR